MLQNCESSILAPRPMKPCLVTEGDAVAVVVHDAEGSSLGLAQVAHLRKSWA